MAAANGGGPVVIADTQDNPGAGGVSATTGMLRALIEAGAEDAALGLIVDPETAAAAHEAGQRAHGPCSGSAATPACPAMNPSKPKRGSNICRTASCSATGPYYGGTELDLGPSACLRIGGVRVVVTSRIAQMADREMFRFVGIVPEEQKILVVKSSTHFRADFAPIASDILVAVAPGPMPLDPADLPFTRLRPGLRLSPNGPAFGDLRAGPRVPTPATAPGSNISKPSSNRGDTHEDFEIHICPDRALSRPRFWPVARCSRPPSRPRRKTKTTITAVMHSGLRVLDPVITTAHITRNHGYMIYDVLTAVDENFKPQPQMAELGGLRRRADLHLHPARRADVPRWRTGHGRRCGRLAQSLGRARFAAVR